MTVQRPTRASLLLLRAIVVSMFPRRTRNRLRTANACGKMDSMFSSTDRLVLVPMRALDDLLELARLASERLPESDVLRGALAGQAATVRAAACPEP
jgi:hypothetical protein